MTSPHDPKDPSGQSQQMEKFAHNMARISERSTELLETFLSKQMANDNLAEADATMLSAMRAFSEMLGSLANNPNAFWQAQYDLYQEYMILWSNTVAQLMGENVDPFDVTKGHKDRRFHDAAWSELIVFNYLKQSYLVMSNWMQDTISDIDDIDDKTRQKLLFYSRQLSEALSPSNFAMTNPQVLRETLDTGGENLVNGLENLLNDMKKSKSMLEVSMTDESAYEVGKTLATTEGSVVYQNDLMQLIQYKPSTETVQKTPLLIVSPWINKYYILDLQSHNSMVKWLVDQGHTVFITSWANPDTALKDKQFEDYLLEGPLAALDVIEEITGESQTHVVGYCLGGTLMSIALAYLKAKGQSDRIKTTTFFTTLTDFSEPGEMGVFIDELQIEGMETKLQKEGVLDGEEMSFIFRSLRASDLIWSFVINNYLMGKNPFPFDLLYWNSDSTAMPAAMHLYYLRNMYLENRLIEPNGLVIDGVPIDLSIIDTPLYMLSTKEDHIAPWKSTYSLVNTVSGSVRFVLSASGHVAGVVNPPSKSKYGYWVHEEGTQKASPTYGNYPDDPDTWFAQSTEHHTSWWTDWDRWLTEEMGDGVVPAKSRSVGSTTNPPLENAPGSYVLVRNP